MNPVNGTPPRTIGQITIGLLENGQVGFNCQVPDPLLAFDMLGKAMSLLAAEVKKAQAKQIEVAPAGLINRLPL